MSAPVNNVHGVEIGLWMRFAEVCKTRKTIFMLRDNKARRSYHHIKLKDAGEHPDWGEFKKLRIWAEVPCPYDDGVRTIKMEGDNCVGSLPGLRNSYELFLGPTRFSCGHFFKIRRDLEIGVEWPRKGGKR